MEMSGATTRVYENLFHQRRRVEAALPAPPVVPGHPPQPPPFFSCANKKNQNGGGYGQQAKDMPMGQMEHHLWQFPATNDGPELYGFYFNFKN
jgi:hypothetical protein